MPKTIDNPERVAWIHLSLGSAAVIAVSIFYFLSPSLAVAPYLGVNLQLAREATTGDRGFMRLAGVFGVLADPFIAVGAFSLAASSRNPPRALGFYWLAAAALLFTVVDALVGFALYSSARAGMEMFSVVKPLFDALTAAASFAYGVSAVLVTRGPEVTAQLSSRMLNRMLALTGFGLAVGSVLVLVGFNAGLAIGAGLTVLTALYLILGLTRQ